MEISDKMALKEIDHPGNEEYNKILKYQ